MSSTRSTRRLVVALFAAVLAVCAVGAGVASAFEEEPAEWQQGKAKLSEAVKTKSKGTIKLDDAGVPAEVECESSGEGTAGPGAATKITSWTLSNCKPTPKAINKKGEEKPNECEKAEGAEITKLPWKGNLSAVSKSVFFRVEAIEEPGFSVKCEALKLKVTDKCRSSLINEIGVGVTNVTGSVKEEFEGGRGLTCTVGGDETGFLNSTQSVEATSGSALEANAV